MMMAWEKKVPHHKWKDELDEEKRVKDSLKEAKKEAKAEDHTKECPFCYHSPVEAVPQHPGLAPDHLHQRPPNCYGCPGCERLYLVKGPGTILLAGNPVIVQGSGQQ
jgi:uncharacterized protein with PIN domain